MSTIETTRGSHTGIDVCESYFLSPNICISVAQLNGKSVSLTEPSVCTRSELVRIEGEKKQHFLTAAICDFHPRLKDLTPNTLQLTVSTPLSTYRRLRLWMSQRFPIKPCFPHLRLTLYEARTLFLASLQLVTNHRCLLFVATISFFFLKWVKWLTCRCALVKCLKLKNHCS